MDKDFPPLNSQDGVQNHIQYESSNEQSRKVMVHPHPQSNVKAAAENSLDDAGWEQQWCIGGYTRVYAVYQPPGFF